MTQKVLCSTVFYILELLLVICLWIYIKWVSGDCVFRENTHSHCVYYVSFWPGVNRRLSMIWGKQKTINWFFKIEILYVIDVECTIYSIPNAVFLLTIFNIENNLQSKYINALVSPTLQMICFWNHKIWNHENNDIWKYIYTYFFICQIPSLHVCTFLCVKLFNL